MSEVDRQEAMAARLTDTFLRSGFPSIDVDRVLHAYWLAMERRRALPEDHPMALHPARSVLIVFHDCGIQDAVILSAAAAVDSSVPNRAVPAQVVAAELGERAAELSAAVPVPEIAGDELLEQMVTAEPAVQIIALAERLDFARHLHLLPGENWPREHALVRSVYLPVALRANPLLGRRFSRWADSFGRRLFHP